MEKTVRFIHNFNNHYYYVLGIKGIEGTTQKARKNYVTTILKFYKEYPFEMLLFYGPTTLLRAAINLSAPFVPFKVRMVQDLKGALNVIEQEKFERLNRDDHDKIGSKPGKSPKSDHLRKYVSDILQYLDKINWGEEQEMGSERTDPSHPFHKVFEALDLIKWEYNDMLNERIKNEEVLRHSKDAAEKANRAKSEFLSSMSHELRTPLNHIIGFCELLYDQYVGPLNPVQSEYLNDVLQSSHHLLSLINDILDLSKVEAGKMEVEWSSVYPRPLLENCIMMVKEKAHQHGIKLETEFNNLPEEIRADDRKLKQVLYNLLANAVKFTPDGGLVCLKANRVRSSESKDRGGKKFDFEEGLNGTECDGDFIQISVMDTGIGLKTDSLEESFCPFEQADGYISRKYQGTGLGLALDPKNGFPPGWHHLGRKPGRRERQYLSFCSAPEKELENTRKLSGWIGQNRRTS